jgi:CheY-like chemotaxis protein
VLLVEDDEDDRLLFQESLQSIYSLGSLKVAREVAEARAILQESPLLPKVVISDYRLGEETGIELLRWIRGEARLRKVPFVLLGTTLSQNILDEAYEAGVNSCILKPMDYAGWESTVTNVLRWWCQYATTPKGSEGSRMSGWQGLPV